MFPQCCVQNQYTFLCYKDLDMANKPFTCYLYREELFAA